MDGQTQFINEMINWHDNNESQLDMSASIRNQISPIDRVSFNQDPKTMKYKIINTECRILSIAADESMALFTF